MPEENLGKTLEADSSRGSIVSLALRYPISASEGMPPG